MKVLIHGLQYLVWLTVWTSVLSIIVGDVSISEGVTLTVDSDLNGASPQFTLTCISTGGPATTVTWTRDSTTVTEGTETVLNDPVTAQYTHTLTVTGRLPGLYRCTVANNKPSSCMAEFTVQGKLEICSPPLWSVSFLLVAFPPTNLNFEVRSDSSDIILTWTPPSPLENTTGYRISFTGGGSSDSVTVSGRDTSSYALTGLTMGETYDISIAGTSEHFFSDSVEWDTITVNRKWCWRT